MYIHVLGYLHLSFTPKGQELSRRSTHDNTEPPSTTTCSQDGRDGIPGLPGRDGLPGLTGRNGQKGERGSPAAAGRNGEPGTPGSNGEPGTPGSNGLRGLQGPHGPVMGGETYIRWGRTTCPSISGTELVYTGWAAGSHFTHTGGGANYLCLTKTPQSLHYSSATNNRAILYGAEYEAQSGQPNYRLHNHNVPCTVCRVTERYSVLMIPGQYTCPTGWTREYYGYLVSQYYGFHRSMYECMDVSPETIPGGQSNQDGALFYHVEPRCGSLPCPPYENTREMTCCVCSK